MTKILGISGSLRSGSYNSALLRAAAQLMPDGTLVLSVGIQSHGQGLETTLAQIAHEELGIDPAKGAGDSYLTKDFLMISIN